MVQTRAQEQRMANERFVAIEHRLDRVDQMQEAIIQLTNRVDTMHRDLLAIRQPGENQQGYGYGRPRQPQLSKMEFPRYEEGQDILSWLLKCESFFLVDRTAEENKVRVASIHLDEKTYQWHRSLEKKLCGRLPLWEEYAVLLQDTFGPPFETPMGDFTHLRQTGSLSEFHAEWDVVTARLDLQEDYLVDAYISALKLEIQGLDPEQCWRREDWPECKRKFSKKPKQGLG